MIKKSILEGRSIKEVESNLKEVEDTIRECLKESTIVKQIYDTSMDKRGMSLTSSNSIDIKSVELVYFKENLVFNVNNFKFSIAMNEHCNISIQRPDPGTKCRIYFNDFQMWLVLI